MRSLVRASILPDRGRATASGDPVGEEKSSSLPRPSWISKPTLREPPAKMIEWAVAMLCRAPTKSFWSQRDQQFSFTFERNSPCLWFLVRELAD
jgi:hypothetical protein